jgi:hypothetical protein
LLNIMISYLLANDIIRLFFFCATGVWTQGLHLELLYQPSFVKVFFFCFFFWDTGSGTNCPGWLRTAILLISASCVASSRCESQCPAIIILF